MKTTTSTKRLFSSLQWAATYRSCGHLGRGQPAFTPQPFRALPRRHDRRITGTSGPRQGNMAPTMEQLRRPFRAKNNTTLFYTLSIILSTVALSYGSVPLYKMICQETGWGGQPIRIEAPTSSNDSPSSPSYNKYNDPSRLLPSTTSKRLRITFNASTSDTLPWKFTPCQREVRVVPGETALAFYKAKNLSTEDIIGVATYSVTPGQVGGYFGKIQCFCFEEQRLAAGEEVDMPVFFYIDKDFENDPQMRGIETVTLSYTFFKARYDRNGTLKPTPGTMMR